MEARLDTPRGALAWLKAQHLGLRLARCEVQRLETRLRTCEQPYVRVLQFGLPKTNR